MILNFVITDSSHLIKSVHTFISITFLVIAVWLFFRSVRGIIKGINYTKTDKLLSFGFIITLYLQLIFGLILFANSGSVADANYPGVEGALKMASKRFWPIEHIVLMLFALLIANLGLILSSQTLVDKEKHKKILIYYVVALIMIAISLSAN
jgi:hypothetical protein